MTQTFRQLPAPQRRKPQGGVPAGSLIAAALLFLFAAFPRLWILGFWIFPSELGEAFSSWVIPAAGFVIAPWTTLLYAWMWAISSNAVDGWEWFVVAAGALLDLCFLAVAARLIRS